MAKSKRAHPAQLPLLGMAAPVGDEPPTQQPLPEREEKQDPAPTQAQTRNEHRPTPEKATASKGTASKGTASKGTAKAGTTFHHHLIVADQITSCHGTLSQALHAQQALQNGASATTTVESYAGNGECRRKEPFQIPERQQPAEENAQAA